MLDIPRIEQAPSGLRDEGAAMLLTIVEGLARAGVEVSVPLDKRLFPESFNIRLAELAHVIELNAINTRQALDVWRGLASSCDWTWLIAPEIDEHLRCLAADLRAAGGQLLNADDLFMHNAGDKLRTADRLIEAGIAHPPTLPLLELDEGWLSTHSRISVESLSGDTLETTGSNALWCVKPSDGAGGEGLKIVTRHQLQQLRAQASGDSGLSGAAGANRSNSTWLVQPWLEGLAASCSAFVDPMGRTTWLPVVSQDFELRNHDAPSDRRGLQPHYVGCTYPAPGILEGAPVSLLQASLQAMQGVALGWIGVDLLFNPQTEQWWVIEVNPRCTSSMVGLVQAYQGNLLGDLCGWLTDGTPRPLAEFRQSTFRLSQGLSHHEP